MVAIVMSMHVEVDAMELQYDKINYNNNTTDNNNNNYNANCRIYLIISILWLTLSDYVVEELEYVKTNPEKKAVCNDLKLLLYRNSTM